MQKTPGRIVSVESKVGPQGCTIRIRGRFDFSAYVPFRTAYHAVPADSHFIIDLGDVHYADSAALGMLLLLRDYAGDAARIVIARCRAQPEQVLRIARIDAIFRFV